MLVIENRPAKPQKYNSPLFSGATSTMVGHWTQLLDSTDCFFSIFLLENELATAQGTLFNAQVAMLPAKPAGTSVMDHSLSSRPARLSFADPRRL
ncbi:MAG: hypothetical protein J0M09_10590 [Xanthomonadales bacterium]|nr:hypothetical protein [Xanthomonadales bacterium]